MIYFISCDGATYFHLDMTGPDTICIVRKEAALLIPGGVFRGRRERLRG